MREYNPAKKGGSFNYKRQKPRKDSYNSSASKSTNQGSSDDGSANRVKEIP
jgi:hypothetical protein